MLKKIRKKLILRCAVTILLIIVVCTKWRNATLSPHFWRSACLERWGEELPLNQWNTKKGNLSFEGEVFLYPLSKSFRN